MVFMGVMMVTGWMNSLTSYLSSFGGAEGSTTSVSSSAVEESQAAPAARKLPGKRCYGKSFPSRLSGERLPQERATPEENTPVPAPDFTLDRPVWQHPHPIGLPGQDRVFKLLGHLVSPLPGNEMPEIQELYEEYGENTGDVIFLGVAHAQRGQRGQLRRRSPPLWRRTATPIPR